MADDFVYTGNIVDGKSYGVEFFGAWSPTPHLNLRGNLIVNEPELSTIDPTFPALSDARLPGASELSGQLAAQYHSDFRFGEKRAEFTFDISASWVGKSELGFGLGQSIGGYGIVDAGMTFEWQDWEASLKVSNLLNENKPTFSDGNPYQIEYQTMITPNRPRTVLMSLRRAF